MISQDLYKHFFSMKLTTAPFKCGEKVKILSNHLSWIVLVEDEGSSKVDYELAKYTDDSLSPTFAGLIGGVIGAGSVLLIVLGIFIYKKCADRKLADKLKH